MDSCYDGQEALEYLESAEYDAVVLDIMMPGTDGLTVLRKMRRRNDATPVILLTAKDSIEDRVAGLDAGANDYLVKPFAFEELLARIRAAAQTGGDAEDLLPGGGSGSPHGYAGGEPRRENAPSVGQGVCAAAVHGPE